MSKILQIILISLFSLTVISCSKDDDSSSTSTTTTASDDTSTTTTIANTCPAENWWQLMEGSTSRNVSLFAPRTLNRHSEQGSGRVLYVDQAALSQYPKRDNYLSFDVFDADIDWTWEMKGHPHGSYIWPSGGGNDQVDLGANAPVLSDNFTQEAWVYSDNITMDYHYRSIMGSGQGLHAAYSNKWDIDTSPTISIITRNWACTTCGINYGFGTGTKLIKFNADVTVPVKVWHHIATTFDGTNYILYMNGEVVDNNTVTAGDTPAATPVRYIGTDLIGKNRRGPYVECSQDPG